MKRPYLKAWLDRHAKFRILALGDSHVRVFEHWAFRFRMPRTRFDIVHVPGATAIGLWNPKSLTGARRVFRDALSVTPADVVILHLGEVDTAYTIWKQAERRRAPVGHLLQIAVDRYWKFVLEVHAAQPVVVLSACLPTLTDQGAPADEVAAVRSTVVATQRERTLLTLAFNEDLATRCRDAGIPFLDSSVAALGPHGIVKHRWVNHRRYDHHYARGPFARWLISQLRALRKDGRLLGRPSSPGRAGHLTAPAFPAAPNP